MPSISPNCAFFTLINDKYGQEPYPDIKYKIDKSRITNQGAYKIRTK